MTKPVEETAPAFLKEWPIAYPRHRGRWTVRSRDGGWGSLDPRAGTATAVAPADDPALPGLAEALERGRLVGYRVGRRAIVATPDRYIKVVRPKRVEALVGTHHWLAEVCPDVATPAVTNVGTRGAVDLAVVPGLSLHEILRRDPAGTSTESAIAQLAVALASFHRTPPAPGLLVREPDDPIDWVETARLGEPGWRHELASIALQLPRLDSRPTVMVHGDLHDKNIFCEPERIGLIDLDGVGLGAPEDDVANLGVHLRLRALQAGRPTISGHMQADVLYRVYDRHRPLDRSRLQAVERHAWFRLACIYRFRATSRHLVPGLLRLAAFPGRAESEVDEKRL